MAEPVWYYARGDVERGPFTLPQIKALVTASRLRPDDLVWKEGMENWTAAKEVPELFPSARIVGDSIDGNGAQTSAESKGAQPHPAIADSQPRTSLTLDGELQAVVRRIVRVLTLVGVIVVVGTRGCESLSDRRVDRIAALAEIKLTEDAANAELEKQVAERARLEYRVAGFWRGVSLYLGLFLLLVGAAGLLTVSTRVERGLGAGLIVAIVLAVLLQ